MARPISPRPLHPHPPHPHPPLSHPGQAALEKNPDSAKPYKVAAKALTKKGEWTAAYEKVCVGMKIDWDEDAAELQKVLKAKCDKMKKIEELQAPSAPCVARVHPA